MTYSRSGHQAAVEQMKDEAWLTIVFAIMLFACNVAAIVLPALKLTPIWLSFIYVTFTFHLNYTIVHDAVHGAISCKNPKLVKLQNLLGFIFSQFFTVPFTAHKKVHLAHHKYTNMGEKDPDHGLGTEKAISLFIEGPRAFLSQRVYYIQNYWNNVPLSERLVFVLENVVAIFWRLLVGLLLSWKVMLFVTVLPIFTGAAWLAFVFSWLVHKPFINVGRYVDTVTYTFPKYLDGIISVLWGYQNYHSVHHLFPRVPFYRYRRVFKHIEKDMLENNAPFVRVCNDSNLRVCVLGAKEVSS